VSEADGGRLRVNRAGRQELLSLPAAVSAGEGELRLFICNGLYDEVVCLRTFGYAHEGVTYLVWCICYVGLVRMWSIFARTVWCSLFCTCCAWSGCTLRRLLHG
jgi:hypothetical protein